MQRKEHFPPEADTQPDVLHAKILAARQSGRAPKKPDGRAELATEPPPPRKPSAKKDARPAQAERKGDEARLSVLRARRGANKGSTAATVDEVVADMSQDPRREHDEDD